MAVKLFVAKAFVNPPGALDAACKIDAGSITFVAFSLCKTNWSGLGASNATPLYACPFNAVTLAAAEEKGEVLALKGRISCTDVKFIDAMSTCASTSQREMTGAHWVADPWGGDVS